MTRERIKEAKRIVFKIGTNSLLNDKNEINYRRIDRLAYALSTLIQNGKEIILVTSGAIGVGSASLNIATRPTEMAEQQAMASVGQVILMTVYSRFFSYYNQPVAQLLLTKDIIDFPESYLNYKNNLEALLNRKIIPIINENDAVSVDEMDHFTRFGDNDTLSAMVTNTTNSDLLVLLTDVDGFYSENPQKNPQAKKFDTISEITEDLIAMAGDKGSTYSIGGMQTKLTAARQLLENNRSTIIMSSHYPSDILNLMEGAPIGTAFIPNQD